MNDTIYRQDAIRTIKRMKAAKLDDSTEVLVYRDDALYRLETLPPAVPEREKGEWVDRSVDFSGSEEWQCAKCSVCELYHTMPFAYYFNELRFCPNCGAEMTVTETEGEEQ